MRELLEKYAKHLELERSISPLTVRNYLHDVRGFLDYLEEQKVGSLEKVDRRTMRGYLGWLHQRKYVRRSITRKLSALRSFYRYLARENLARAQPLSSLSAPKLEKRLPAFLGLEEVWRLLEAPQCSSPLESRDRAILETLYAAGLRVSELAALDLEDISLDSREIRVWGKGSRERIALIGGPAASALADYMDRARLKLMGKDETNALFLNRFGCRLSERGIQNMVRKYARKAGIDMRVFPHVMRHTFATHLLDGGADLRSVQDLLGHARLSSTQVYTHVTRSQMRRNYLAAHPRSRERKEQ
ncbi:MAG: tyrosine recombinase [Dehalococcoidia bacterium]|nr:tyrosine recombinase [Dehalococcoidia bacterium]